MLCLLNTITTTSGVGRTAPRTTVRLWGFVVTGSGQPARERRAALRRRGNCGPCPESPQLADMLPRVDLLGRHEVMDSREPPDVKIRQQSSQDGGPDLLLLACQVAIAVEHRELALPKVGPIEPMLGERRHHRGDPGWAAAHPGRRGVDRWW